MKRPERVYRWLLRLYPRDFRDEYGEEMSLLFRARLSEGSAALWLQVLGDLIFHAPQEHWNGVKQDLRYAFRQLRRSPGFSAAVVATLGLGIGGTTAVFSVVEAVLVTSLPYEASGQLVRIYQEEPAVASSRTGVTGPHFKEVRDRASTFEDVAAFKVTDGADLIANNQAQRLRVLQVTSGYFRTLRVSPQRGRAFERADENGARYVILSDALWRTRFSSNPSAIGATVNLSAEPYVVVGIAPPGFQDPIVGEMDAWVPHNLARNNNEEDYTLSAFGRLRTGVGLEQAQERSRLSPERWRRSGPAYAQALWSFARSRRTWSHRLATPYGCCSSQSVWCFSWPA